MGRIYVREEISMPYLPAWSLQDHPLESFQEACTVNSLLFWLKYPFKISSSTFAAKLILIIFFPVTYICPLCSFLMCKSDCIICLFISVSIVSLPYSFLISCKCSILLPVVFLSYKYPSSPTFVAAALTFFNILSHFCHPSYTELREWWIWLPIALL